MKKIKTKIKLSITIDEDVFNYINENFNNKSKYIEYLIFKDLSDNNLLKNNFKYYGDNLSNNK